MDSSVRLVPPNPALTCQAYPGLPSSNRTIFLLFCSDRTPSCCPCPYPHWSSLHFCYTCTTIFFQLYDFTLYFAFPTQLPTTVMSSDTCSWAKLQFTGKRSPLSVSPKWKVKKKAKKWKKDSLLLGYFNWNTLGKGTSFIIKKRSGSMNNVRLCIYFIFLRAQFGRL